MERVSLAAFRQWWSHFFWNLVMAFAVSFAVSHWLGGSLFGCPAWACGLIVAVVAGSASACQVVGALVMVVAHHSDKGLPILEKIGECLDQDGTETFRALSERHRRAG